MSTRLAHLPDYAGLAPDGSWTGEVRVLEDKLKQPLGWRKPKLIFVAPHGDLFHAKVAPQTILRVFGVMAAARQHTYLVLTKRPARALDWLALRAPLPNVWIGFSAEDQVSFDARWEHARQWAGMGWQTWVSLEPLLGPVDLRLTCSESSPLRWVVTGGESGRFARPMHPDWARSLRDQCVAGPVPFFFKQWGEWSDAGDAHELAEAGESWRGDRVINVSGGHGFHGTAPRRVRRVGTKAAGRLLDGELHDAYPEGMRHGG